METAAFKALRSLLARPPYRMPLRDYMAFCLHHPSHGYYRTHTPVGKTGDFITAPEISQVFGEILGLWFISKWGKIQAFSPPLCFLELGSGLGTLLKDLLRTFQIRPTFLQSLQLHLVDINPFFKEYQKSILQDFSIPFCHHETLEKALEACTPHPLFIVGNEFLDAFPIDQYIYRHGTWQKRFVTLAEQDLSLLVFSEEACLPPAEWLPASLPQEGDILEVSPLVLEVSHQIFTYITTYGGAGLLIDYGYDALSYGDTLQAIAHHRFKDPFSNPGHQDLTTHINFGMLQKALQTYPNLHHRLMSQSLFLKEGGIHLRTEKLAQGKSLEMGQKIYAATERLCAANQMGSLFKVLQFWHSLKN